MQRLILSGLAALAAALPFASHADTMDYSYAEFGYVDTERDVGDADVDGDGFALRGSVAFLESFFGFATYQDIGYDSDLDATLLQVGIGGHWPVRDRLDLVGHFGIAKAEVERGRFEDDEDGFLLGARLRGTVAPKFELEGGFDYMDLDDAGDDTFLVGEGRYFFTEQLAGGLLLQIGDDTTSIGINARLTF